MQFFKNFARLFLSGKTAGYTMNKPLKRRMSPPGGGWDAFILFWTGVTAVELAYQHIFVEDSEAVYSDWPISRRACFFL